MPRTGGLDICYELFCFMPDLPSQQGCFTTNELRGNPGTFCDDGKVSFYSNTYSNSQFNKRIKRDHYGWSSISINGSEPHDIKSEACSRCSSLIFPLILHLIVTIKFLLSHIISYIIILFNCSYAKRVGAYRTNEPRH